MGLRLPLAGLLLVGCYCSHEVAVDASAIDAADAEVDAALPVFVSGCEDPRLWSTELPSVELQALLGGGPCSPPQYPLHVVSLGWPIHPGAPGPALEDVATSCWRVTAAADGSGWRVGDTFEGGPHGLGLAAIIGFERPVRFEGRVITNDGRAALAVAEGEVQLDPLRAVSSEARGEVGGEVRAIATESFYATSEAVHLEGEVTPVAPFADAAALSTYFLATLRRDPAGVWVHESFGRLAASSETPLAPAARALLARGGAHVALDDELWILEVDGPRRVPLPGPPISLLSGYGYLCGLLAGGELFCHDQVEHELHSRLVGEGRLVTAAPLDPPYFFDGETFHGLSRDDPTAFDPARSFRPVPEDLSLIGEPLAVQHGVVIGTEGFLDARPPDGRPGPRVARLDDVMEPGAITVWGADQASYAVRHDDGTTAIYRAPFIDFCD